MASISTSFWWERAGRAPIGVPGLEGVIFSLDAVLTDARADHALFAELVWDLHCAGIRIAVATSGRGTAVHRSMRELLGDGAVEVVITGDEVANPKPHPEVYHHALWELGLRAGSVLAIEDSADGLRAAMQAGLTTVVVTTERTSEDDFTGAAAVLPGFDGPEPLSVHRCRRLCDQMIGDRSGALSA
ncbi:MAG: HAD family hydrolase [Mycobacterium sp.]